MKQQNTDWLRSRVCSPRLREFFTGTPPWDRFLRDELGQDLVEYGLVMALIALAATASMSSMAAAISNAFSTVGSHLGTYSS